MREITKDKSKYFINGKLSTQKDVVDLFLSAGMNINNPHFLVMQGMITKVINMKPVEILSLIEESIGTSLYEKRKKEAENTLERRKAKIAGLEEKLEVDIKQ